MSPSSAAPCHWPAPRFIADLRLDTNDPTGALLVIAVSCNPGYASVPSPRGEPNHASLQTVYDTRVQANREQVSSTDALRGAAI